MKSCSRQRPTVHAVIGHGFASGGQRGPDAVAQREVHGPRAVVPGMERVLHADHVVFRPLPLHAGPAPGAQAQPACGVCNGVGHLEWGFAKGWVSLYWDLERDGLVCMGISKWIGQPAWELGKGWANLHKTWKGVGQLVWGI